MVTPLKAPEREPFWCRTCSKWAYWTASDAGRVLRTVRKNSSHAEGKKLPGRIYQGSCTFWHLTSEKRRRK